MQDYTALTLGELLSHHDEMIKRNAVSILKRLQRESTAKRDKTLLKALNTDHGSAV